jgi:hypothetical protein
VVYVLRQAKTKKFHVCVNSDPSVVSSVLVRFTRSFVGLWRQLLSTFYCFQNRHWRPCQSLFEAPMRKSQLKRQTLAISSDVMPFIGDKRNMQGWTMGVYVFSSNNIDVILKSQLFWKILDLMAIWRAKKGRANITLTQTLDQKTCYNNHKPFLFFFLTFLTPEPY